MRVVLLAAWSLASIPAIAAQDSRPGRDDRVRSVVFREGVPTRVMTAPMTSTRIKFAEGETVTHVATGDDAGWLFVPTGNVLFVKPKGERSTNAQIRTKRTDGTSRDYDLDLIVQKREAMQVASNGEIVPDAIKPVHIAVNFTYPADVRAERVARHQAALAGYDERVALDRLAVDHKYGQRHYAYTAQGSAAIEPFDVYDNDQSTTFRFPGNQAVPVIYSGACGPGETIVPYAMKEDAAVVQVVASKFCLRLGREHVLEIARVGAPTRGTNPGTGTTSPEIVRSVRDMAAR